MSRCLTCPALLLVLLPAVAAGGDTVRVDRYGDPLPPRALVRLGTRRLRHDVYLAAAAYSPDGKRVAALDYDGQLILWDLASGKHLFRRPARRGRGHLLFSPDGKWLAVANWSFRILEAATGKEVLSDPESAGEIFAFSSDSKTAASVRGGHTVVLWDLLSHKKKRHFKTVPGVIRSLKLSEGEQVLALVEEGKMLTLWDLGAARRQHSFPRPGESCAAGIAPDLRHIAVGGPDAFLALYDRATGKELHRLRGHQDQVCHVAFSPDGRSLFSGDNTGHICIWDVATGKKRWMHTHAPGGGAFSPDSKTVITFGANGPHGLQFFDVASGKELRPFPGHLTRVSTVAFSPDGKRLLTSDWIHSDPAALLWDAQTGKVIREFRGHPWGVDSAVFSPDGRLVATAAWLGDSTVRLWDAETGAERRRFTVDSSTIAIKARFSPDGKWLAAYRYGNQGQGGPIFWDINSGKLVKHIAAPREQTVHALSFTPDGQTIVRGSPHGLWMWDVTSGAELPSLQEDSRTKRGPFPIRGLAFSPDGRFLATTGEEQIRLWEMSTRRPLFILPPGYVAAFSPDGRFLAVDREKSVVLLDVASGKGCMRLTEGAENVVCLAFSPDGKRLVSGSSDSTALIWDVSDLPKRAPRPTACPTDAKALALRWASLRGEAVVSHQAGVELAAAGDAAARYLGQQLAKRETPDPRLLAKLIRDLDDDAFSTREAATKQLRYWGPDADEALRRALGNKPTPEQKQRITRILAARAAAFPVSEQIRQLRAIAVLERIGSPEARGVLRTLAKGPREARLTHEAKAALDRLNKKRPASP